MVGGAGGAGGGTDCPARRISVGVADEVHGPASSDNFRDSDAA